VLSLNLLALVMQIASFGGCSWDVTNIVPAVSMTGASDYGSGCPSYLDVDGKNGTPLIVLVLIIAFALITLLFFFSWRLLCGEFPPHGQFNSFFWKRLEALSERFDSIRSLYGMAKRAKQVMSKSLLAYAKALIGFW